MNIKQEDIKDMIQKSRPNLKPVSVNQYYVQLKKLQNIFDAKDYKFLNRPKNVEDKLQNLHFTSIRNMYNAIIILLHALNNDSTYDKLIETYSEMRDVLNSKYQDENKHNNKVSDKQAPNFVDMKEIESMISELKQEVDILKKKKTLTKSDISTLRAYVLFSMLSKIPTRNDASNMLYISQTAYKRLTDEEKQKNNYLVNQRNNLKFIYNVYKTSKKYGENVISVSKELKPILRLYLKLMNYKINDNIFPLSRNAISQLLIKTSKRLIGKNISSTMIRKSYLSTKYGDMKQEMEADAKLMMHDINTAQSVYTKQK
jgi:hypothetical protein